MGAVTARGRLGAEERGAWVDALNQQLARSAAEISRRSIAQQALQAANVSAVSAIAAFVVSGRSSPLLLLLVPLVSSALGSQWLDSHGCIQRIGVYLAREVEPALVAALGEPPVERFAFWETYVREVAKRSAPSAIWTLPTAALFQGVALAGLVLSFPAAVLHPDRFATGGLSRSLIEVWPRTAWTLALVVTALSCRSAWQHLGPRRARG